MGIVDQLFHDLPDLPVQNPSGYRFRRLKGFGQKGCIAGIFHVQIALIDEEVEEGLQLGVSETPSGFAAIPCHCLQELENLIRSD